MGLVVLHSLNILTYVEIGALLRSCRLDVTVLANLNPAKTDIILTFRVSIHSGPSIFRGCTKDPKAAARGSLSAAGFGAGMARGSFILD